MPESTICRRLSPVLLLVAGALCAPAARAAEAAFCEDGSAVYAVRTAYNTLERVCEEEASLTEVTINLGGKKGGFNAITRSDQHGFYLVTMTGIWHWKPGDKAAAVALAHPAATVIGADTLVFIDGEPLGKPADLAEARAMLRRLAGRTHTVCTGVCVIHPGAGAETFHELTEVVFRVLDEAAIDTYLALVDPLDKAGAYGIQERGDLIIETIRGSFDNVMGLPVARVVAAVRRDGQLWQGK